MGSSVELLDKDAPLFPISTAAQLAGMHPQTLRAYDRLGLVVPTSTRGRGRRYTLRDIARLRMVQYLSQDEGINLNGVRRILELELHLDQMRQTMDELVAEIRALRAAPAAARLFTAAADGVHLGAVRRPPPRAITR
jgi:MerR family transcriptional regulator/heat shock protein HspR